MRLVLLPLESAPRGHDARKSTRGGLTGCATLAPHSHVIHTRGHHQCRRPARRSGAPGSRVMTSRVAARGSPVAFLVRVAFLRSESPRARIDGAFADYADADLILLARWRG